MVKPSADSKMLITGNRNRGYYSIIFWLLIWKNTKSDAWQVVYLNFDCPCYCFVCLPCLSQEEFCIQRLWNNNTEHRRVKQKRRTHTALKKNRVYYNIISGLSLWRTTRLLNSLNCWQKWKKRRRKEKCLFNNVTSASRSFVSHCLRYKTFSSLIVSFSLRPPLHSRLSTCFVRTYRIQLSLQTANTV